MLNNRAARAAFSSVIAGFIAVACVSAPGKKGDVGPKKEHAQPVRVLKPEEKVFLQPANKGNGGGRTKPQEIRLEDDVEKRASSGKSKEEKFSIHFKEMPLDELVGMLSGQGRNFRYAIHPDVGKRNVSGMSLDNATWRQTLEIVAKLLNLVISEEQGIVIINSADNVDKLREGEQKRLENSEKMAKIESARLAETAKSREIVEKETSVFRSFRLKYSDPAEVKAYLEKIFNSADTAGPVPSGGTSGPPPSSAPKILFATFSKASVLTAYGAPRQLDEVEKRLAEIDVPQQQIYLEARIVEVSRSYSRELGVEWGGASGAPTGGTTVSGSAVAPAIGSGVVVGSTGSGGWTSGGTAAGNAAVSFPAVDPAGSMAAGFSLAVVSGTAQLNMRLSALEAEGKGRTLSNPKITTINGVTAEINSGREIPYQQAAGGTVGGTTIAFKNAVISLEVTPFVTPDSTINLKIKARKDDADFTNMVLGTPSILTRSVSTNVLVMDGGTAVLGGVFENSKSDLEKGVPWLSKIPLFGWLFKGLQNVDNEKELLIFITPHIVKGNFS